MEACQGLQKRRKVTQIYNLLCLMYFMMNEWSVFDLVDVFFSMTVYENNLSLTHSKQSWEKRWKARPANEHVIDTRGLSGPCRMGVQLLWQPHKRERGGSLIFGVLARPLLLIVVITSFSLFLSQIYVWIKQYPSLSSNHLFASFLLICAFSYAHTTTVSR